MPPLAQTLMRNNGASRCEDHHQDLVHELSQRLDTLRRCGQYVANAEGHVGAIEFWLDLERQEQKNIVRLQQLLTETDAGPATLDLRPAATDISACMPETVLVVGCVKNRISLGDA